MKNKAQQSGTSPVVPRASPCLLLCLGGPKRHPKAIQCPQVCTAPSPLCQKAKESSTGVKERRVRKRECMKSISEIMFRVFSHLQPLPLEDQWQGRDFGSSPAVPPRAQDGPAHSRYSVNIRRKIMKRFLRGPRGGLGRAGENGDLAAPRVTLGVGAGGRHHKCPLRSLGGFPPQLLGRSRCPA